MSSLRFFNVSSPNEGEAADGYIAVVNAVTPSGQLRRIPLRANQAMGAIARLAHLAAEWVE